MRIGITAKMVAVVSILAAISLSGSVATYLVARGQESDGRVINLAGAQRMLSQKMAKETLVAVSPGASPSDREALRATVDRFSKVLHGLIDGDPELALPPTSDPEILAGLEEVKSMWAPVQAKVDAIVRAQAPDTLSGVAHEVVGASSGLLDKMNAIVAKFEARNRAAVQRLVTLQIGLALVALLAAVFARYMMNRFVAQPIQSMARSL